MKNLKSLVLLWLFLGINGFISGQIVSSSATYTLGNIPSDRAFGNINQSSACPGNLTVTIPVGATITSVSVVYDFEALTGSFRAFQVSQLRCTSPGGVNEASLAVNNNYSTGVQSYSRTGLTIANGVAGGGNITFQLHAGLTNGSQVGCSEQYNRVKNNTWTVTVFYFSPAFPSEVTNPYPADEATDVPVDIGNLTWTFGSNTNFYDLYFGTTNPPLNKVVDNQPSGVTGSYSPGILDGGKSYYWKVVSRNASGNETPGPVWTFITECVPFNIPVVANFDDLEAPNFGGDVSSAIPNCWKTIYKNASWYAANGVYGTPNAFTAPNCYIASNEGDGNAYNYMIGPEMATSLSSLQISLMSKVNGGIVSVTIGTMSDNNDTATFTPFTTIELTSVYTQFDIPFASYSGTDKYIAIRFLSPAPNMYNYVFYDNILISDIPNCLRPKNLIAINKTNTQALVDWTEVGTATQWNIEIVPTGTSPTGNFVTTSNKPYTFTNLQPNTSYDFYIRSVCGGGSFSYWSNKGTFKTFCSPVTVPVFENFDASTQLPDCWTIARTTATEWSIPNFQSYSAPNNFQMGISSLNQQIILVSPPLSAPSGGMQEIKLNFFAKRTPYDQTIIIGTLYNPLDVNSFTPFKTITPTTGWAEYEVWFNTYTGTDQYIGFKCGNLSTIAKLNLDNINIGLLTNCLNPVNLNVTEIHETNARLNFTESRVATQWEIEVGPYGFTPGTNTYIQTYIYTLANNNYSYVMTGLQPGVFYDVYMRALCGAGEVSLWSPKTSFLSQPSPFGPLPLIETFDPDFTNTRNVPTNNINFSLFTTLYHSAPNSAKCVYAANNNNILLTSKRIDLTNNANAYLSFWHIAKTERNRDHCFVEISTDGGATWDQFPVSAYTGLGNYYTPTQNLPEGPCFDETSYPEWGISNETPDNTWWRNENLDLSPYIGSDNVLIRFRLVSDNSTNKYGWLLDDISIKIYNGVNSGVDPLSYSVKLESGQSINKTLTITNTGDFPLLYEAAVQDYSDAITTLVSENFENAFPSSWTKINGTQSSPSSQWQWAEYGVAPNNMNGTDYMYVGRVYPDTCNESLISPAFNSTGYSNVFLEFDYIYIRSSSTSVIDYAEVFVWDGATWHSVLYLKTANVGAWGSPASFKMDVTQYANPNMKVKFYYAGYSGSRFAIDNFKATVSDIPLDWVKLNGKPSTRGLIQGGESNQIAVTIKAWPTFPEDIWHSVIRITSNDQNNTPLTIPVTMTIGCLNPWNYQETGVVHSITLPVGLAPEIYGVPLANKDWIGVFYLNGNGVETCGGAVQWNGNGGLVINAYGDDPLTPEKDGFAPGEAFKWRLYSCSGDKDYGASVTYDPNMPNQGAFANSGSSKLTSLNVYIIQQYAFNQGWNSISSYVIPVNPTVESMFANLGSNFTILRNLDKMYWPSEGINTIGNWNNNSGYVTKVTGAVNFSINGNEMAAGNLNLPVGWSYMPSLATCAVNITDLFIGNLNNIVIIQELIGTRVFWPAFQIYTLQTLQPGKAYSIKLANQVSITFPACSSLKSAIQPPASDNQFESAWGVINANPSSQLIVFLEGSLGNFSSGDMIGAFDHEGNPFGYAIIEDVGQNLSMTVFGDDVTTENIDGFANQEPLSFKLMKAANGEVINLDIEYSAMLENTTGTFISGSFAAVSNVKAGVTGINSTLSAIRIYPNPASDMLNITGIEAPTKVSIYNVFGEEVYHGEFYASARINVGSLAKGTYAVRLTASGGSQVSKLVIR